MSAPDEKTKEVSEEAAHDSLKTKKEKDSSSGIIVLFFFIGLLASLFVGWVIYPSVLYCKKSQPIDFNHVVHMQEVDGCESCHLFREDGTYAGVPSLAQCIDCHEEVLGESEHEETFVNEYVANNREVPWLIYSKQPDCVFFSHAAHVKAAGIECETCHGDIGLSTSLKDYEYNFMTGCSRDIYGKSMIGIKKHSWDRMKMDDCDECHKESGTWGSSVQTERDACFVCHK